MPTYSIVIPAFEEAALITDTLKTVSQFLKDNHLHSQTEVVVVAARGKDNTAQLAKKQSKLFNHFQLIEPGPKVGKGRDVKAGMMAARGKYRLFTDADLATPIHHCLECFKILEQGRADVVIGVRDLWAIHEGLQRKVVSVGANWLVRSLLPTVPDSQCGFKGFSAIATKQLFSKMTITGWGFDIELLVTARAHKMSIAKIKIDDWHDPKAATGLVGESTSQAAVSTLKELMIIWKKRLRGAYR